MVLDFHSTGAAEPKAGIKWTLCRISSIGIHNAGALLAINHPSRNFVKPMVSSRPERRKLCKPINISKKATWWALCYRKPELESMRWKNKYSSNLARAISWTIRQLKKWSVDDLVEKYLSPLLSRHVQFNYCRIKASRYVVATCVQFFRFTVDGVDHILGQWIQAEWIAGNKLDTLEDWYFVKWNTETGRCHFNLKSCELRVLTMNNKSLQRTFKVESAVHGFNLV